MSSERTDRRGPTAGPHRFVGVTYGEFQSLYHYGRGRIPRDRVVPLKMKADGRPSASAKKRVPDLLERLPQLMLDDQEGVVILELEPPQAVSRGEKVIEVGIGDVRNVIPTTRRAKRILEPRMRSLGVALDGARFEDHVLERWSRRNVENAIDGGQALCRLLLGPDGRADEKGAAEAVGDDGERQLQAAVEAAIRQLDRQEGQDVDEEAAATWIPAAYRFTRHDPYDYGAIDYLIDSGQVLKKLSWPERSDGVERCREVVRGVLDRRSGISTLADVVGDSDVVNLAAVLEETAPGLFPAGFRSLVIFCRWKELFHGWREAVDLQALGNEARELVVAGIDFRSVRESLWLLGCFAGHERVAPMRYAAEAHSWWCGEKLSPAKITCPATGTAREGEVSRAGGEPAGADGEPSASATKPGTIGDGAMSGEARDKPAVAEPETLGAGALSGEARKPAAAAAFGADEASGESGEPAATTRPETFGADEASGVAEEPVGAAAKPGTVGNGASSGEAEEQAPAAGELVAVPDGALSEEGGEQAATAGTTGREPGRLPFEPPE